MITPVHILSSIIIYLVSGSYITILPNDIFWLFSAELIDIDHFFAKKVYISGRNSLKTHVLHKKWPFVILAALVLLFFRPVMFLGIGLMLHIFLDHLENKIRGV